MIEKFLIFDEYGYYKLSITQRAIITALSYSLNFVKEVNNMVKSYDKFVTVVRGDSKTFLQMNNMIWAFAPCRIKHLALHAKKKRVRKKNMRRIFKW
jgi:hypothetical protein